MSPTKRPFQPTFFAFVANRSMKRMSCGLPQLRLRDGRMTCQAGPVIGSDTAPAWTARPDFSAAAAAWDRASREASGQSGASPARRQDPRRRGRRGGKRQRASETILRMGLQETGIKASGAHSKHAADLVLTNPI